MPKVSVIVPNYNHARFLPQRLDSIFAQTFRDHELIVLDDASADNSREVLEGYAAKNPMRLVFNEKNSGSPFAQWRKGAELAGGEYLWIAESDDYASPRLLETLFARLQKNPNAGLAYCQSFMVNENSQVLGTLEAWTQPLDAMRWKQDYVNAGQDEVSRYLVRRNTIPNASAVLVRRDIFLQAIPEAESLRLTGDWWTWSRVLLHSDVAYVAEPMNFFRKHAKSVRDTTRDPVACAEDFTVVANICSKVLVPQEIRDAVFRELLLKWKRCFNPLEFRPDAKWLQNTRACACIVDRAAASRMSWFLVKQKVRRMRFVTTLVRALRKVFHHSTAGQAGMQ